MESLTATGRTKLRSCGELSAQSGGRAASSDLPYAALLAQAPAPRLCSGSRLALSGFIDRLDKRCPGQHRWASLAGTLPSKESE